MLWSKARKRIEKSPYFPKFLFERITKIGVIGKMGL